MTTFGSLFSGVGGFDLGFERAGMECRWQVEIDDKARAVLDRHWPQVEKHTDVRDVGRHNLEPVDVICGGFPCQDVSVAGRRQGLAGERSGLWFEFHRIVGEMLPTWVVIENVPGLLSSNEGKDIQVIIDSLTQIGYTVDVDILDAQYFGVPQRRRRVFLTCVRLDALLKQKTSLSARISADLVAQILLNGWGVLPPAWSAVLPLSDYDKPAERCAALLKKMMSLSETARERLACKKYQNALDVLLDQFGDEDKNSAPGLTARNEPPDPLLPVRDMCASLLKKATGGDGRWSISTLLSRTLDDALETVSKSTTSISTQPKTNWKIFTFAVMGLHTIERITRSLDWSVSCWSVASSVSIVLMEFMNYARRASSDLFVEPGLRDGWRDYLGAASHLYGELERRAGAGGCAKVFSQPEGCVRDTAPQRTAGKAAPTLFASGAGTDRTASAGSESEFCIEVVPALTNSGRGVERTGESRGQDPVIVARGLTTRQSRLAGDADNFIAHSLRSEGADASEDGTGRGTPLVFQQNMRDEVRLIGGDGSHAGALAAQPGMKQQNYVFESRYARNGRGAPDTVAPPLKAENGQTGKGDGAPLTFQPRYYSDRVRMGGQPNTEATGALSADAGEGDSSPHVAGSTGVRRLMPVECERLMGWPDNFTEFGMVNGKLVRQSDSARYRQCGNGVVGTVSEWLGRRIQECSP